MNVWKHFCTITHHKNLVMLGCFQVGLIKQGLLHDLSKYTPTEFIVGCKYYQGTMSPNNAERLECGYSSAWLHHKGRNKHHLEYWIDYGVPGKDGKGEKKGLCGMRMPVKYVVEMYIDRVAAAKNYQKDLYSNESPLKYYFHGKDVHVLHDDTRALLELLLVKLSVDGEKATNRFIREEILTGAVPYEKEALEALKDSISSEKNCCISAGSGA